MAANHIDFELSAAEIDAILTYTPSKEPQETQDFFGRRQLRVSMGQDPALHAWKFTPPQPHAFNWPTDKECLLWAEAGKRKANKQLSLLGILPGETPQMNKRRRRPRRLRLPLRRTTATKRPLFGRCLSIWSEQRMCLTSANLSSAQLLFVSESRMCVERGCRARGAVCAKAVCRGKNDVSKCAKFC